jgi:hypothetical protein
MYLDPNKPSIGYWMFDTPEEAEYFYNTLMKGCSAWPITVDLEDPESGRPALRSFRMGDEENPAVPLVKYSQPLRDTMPGAYTTDDGISLID